ncbi:MAG: 50S ribosomal protein L44e [Candidatus Pacearchaeota archaeon]
MKLPKKVKRYCKYCKKHTEQKVELVSAAHTRGSLKRGSPQRARLRGKNRGYGNLGRYSKPPISRWKRKTKGSKKTNILYTCTVCNKSMPQSKGIRASKVELK